METLRTVLEREFCPPIDTALFQAILLDFNLETTAGLQEARSILEAIKSNAEAEEATGFDPSGSSTVTADVVTGENIDHSSSRHGESASKTTETDLTSETCSINSLGPDDGTSPFDRRIEALSFEDKQALLGETFPGVAPFTIAHTLRKCHEDFEKAVDELLNAVLFAEGEDSEGEQYKVPKGIEGFAQPASSTTKSKGRRRKERKAFSEASSRSSSAPLADLPTNAPNKWDRGSQEITFISQRTKVPRASISSCYHREGGSLKRTIIALAQDEIIFESTPLAEDASFQSEAVLLTNDFPDIRIEHLSGIVRLTHPSTASAHELAKATLRNPFPAFEQQSIASLLPSYSRLKLDDTTSDSSSSSTFNRASEPPHVTSPNPSALATTYHAARADAFAKASAAYRKSRSHPLMGGAASYYAQVGRDAQAHAAAYSAEAADVLAARQSSAVSIDLHGLDVQNAVRIALEKVDHWWTGGAAEWAREGRVQGNGGFAIVTGAGRHSQGGRAKIGPAVKKALREGGWRIDTDDAEGVVLVKGRVMR